MSAVRIFPFPPPSRGLKPQRQRDGNRTSTGPVTRAADTCAGAAEARIVRGDGDEERAAIQRTLGGDPDALATLFLSDQARLYRDAFSLLRNKEDAEDALQNALLSAYLNLDTFEGKSRFSTWLTRIVLNASLMNRRKRCAHPHVSLDEIMSQEPKLPLAAVVDARPDPEQAFRQMENRCTVVGAIALLSPCLRSALHLRYLQGLSIKEAAELEGVSTAVMKSRSLRARRQLASRLHLKQMSSRFHLVDRAVAQRTLALPGLSRLPGLRGKRKG